MGQVLASASISDEAGLAPAVSGAFNDSFFGNSIGMVALPRWPIGRFRSPVDGPTDMAHREVWVRVAEVFDGLSIPAGATGFTPSSTSLAC